MFQNKGAKTVTAPSTISTSGSHGECVLSIPQTLGSAGLEEETSISRYNRTPISHNMAATQALGLQCVWGPATKQKRETPSFLVIDPGFPCSSVGKESACNAGDLGLIPGLGRSPGEGNGNPLQYSCLENPKDKAAWQATVQETDSWTLSWTPTSKGSQESVTTYRLNHHHHQRDLDYWLSY